MEASSNDTRQEKRERKGGNGYKETGKSNNFREQQEDNARSAGMNIAT
jgi:hypothetical protein